MKSGACLDRLLGPQNKTLNETNPSINAKLPATPHNPGGGRIKALHPVIAPPGRNPCINIRLYEQKPVKPEWLLERGVMNAEMMDLLRQAMEDGQRILISGGTRTGKTTLLSALCNFLPGGWRIVKIEDPEEIWIDRPTVQTVEARPQAVGTDVRPYTLADGVDDAMRMSPDYLIIGEVRDGAAAMSLFRALMTGHSGACTFHADSPREAARRLATVMGADAGGALARSQPDDRRCGGFAGADWHPPRNPPGGGRSPTFPRNSKTGTYGSSPFFATTSNHRLVIRLGTSWASCNPQSQD